MVSHEQQQGRPAPYTMVIHQDTNSLVFLSSEQQCANTIVLIKRQDRLMHPDNVPALSKIIIVTSALWHPQQCVQPHTPMMVTNGRHMHDSQNVLPITDIIISAELH